MRSISHFSLTFSFHRLPKLCFVKGVKKVNDYDVFCEICTSKKREIFWAFSSISEINLNKNVKASEYDNKCVSSVAWKTFFSFLKDKIYRNFIANQFETRENWRRNKVALQITSNHFKAFLIRVICYVNTLSVFFSFFFVGKIWFRAWKTDVCFYGKLCRVRNGRKLVQSDSIIKNILFTI